MGWGGVKDGHAGGSGAGPRHPHPAQRRRTSRPSSRAVPWVRSQLTTDILALVAATNPAAVTCGSNHWYFMLGWSQCAEIGYTSESFNISVGQLHQLAHNK